jgi:hypothetical protein
MLPKEISSEELRRLTGYGKSTITELEQAGTISRSAKDTWPIETVTKVIAHLRERKPALSEEQRAYHAEKTKMMRLRYAQEINKLGSTEEMITALEMLTGWFIATMEALPSAIRQARTDKGLRAELQQWVFNQRNALAKKSNATAAGIKEGAEVKIWL